MKHHETREQWLLAAVQLIKPIFVAKKHVVPDDCQVSWWVDAGQGVPFEPYDLLKDYGSTLLGETVLAGEDPDDLVIANGGAAATAYARLQFEELGTEPRQKICEALLRYCELDTLAMVMIVEAWKEFVFTV